MSKMPGISPFEAADHTITAIDTAGQHAHNQLYAELVDQIEATYCYIASRNPNGFNDGVNHMLTLLSSMWFTQVDVDREITLPQDQTTTLRTKSLFILSKVFQDRRLHYGMALERWEETVEQWLDRVDIEDLDTAIPFITALATHTRRVAYPEEHHPVEPAANLIRDYAMYHFSKNLDVIPSQLAGELFYLTHLFPSWAVNHHQRCTFISNLAEHCQQRDRVENLPELAAGTLNLLDIYSQKRLEAIGRLIANSSTLKTTRIPGDNIGLPELQEILIIHRNTDPDYHPRARLHRGRQHAEITNLPNSGKVLLRLHSPLLTSPLPQREAAYTLWGQDTKPTYVGNAGFSTLELAGSISQLDARLVVIDPEVASLTLEQLGLTDKVKHIGPNPNMKLGHFLHYLFYIVDSAPVTQYEEPPTSFLAISLPIPH